MIQHIYTISANLLAKKEEEVWHLWEINLIDCDDAHEKYGVSAIIEKGSVNKSSNILLVL